MWNIEHHFGAKSMIGKSDIERPLRNIALRRRFESFTQDLGADKAGHCLAKGQVVALGEVDLIHPIGRHNFASVEKRNLKEPGQVAIVLSQLDSLFRPP